jgi:hypothetical protein
MDSTGVLLGDIVDIVIDLPMVNARSNTRFRPKSCVLKQMAYLFCAGNRTYTDLVNLLYAM